VWAVIVAGKVVYLLTTYYLVDLISSYIESDKLSQLELEVGKVKQEEKTVVAKIEALQREVTAYKA
jgi:hypothetical protein